MLLKHFTMHSYLRHSHLLFQVLSISVIFTCLLVSAEKSSERYGFVRISDSNITAFNNRNLTIVCHADLSNQTENISFTTNARMVLTFMTIPRQVKALHQIQSFLHCIDPNRTQCLAEFNFDIGCLEDQMDQSYYLDYSSYVIEAACQVDDNFVCSQQWMMQHSTDCFDLGQITIIKAPKLGEKCIHLALNKTMECGYNQECHPKFGICLCKNNFISFNHQCVPGDPPVYQDDEDEYLSLTKNLTYTEQTDSKHNHVEHENPNVSLAGTQSTFKAIVIFLLVIAILLCIALGIVIIWSRHYRHLLEHYGTSL